MTIALLTAVGAGCLVVALVLLRSVGPGYRIARLLSATRELPLPEAAELASEGRQRYVRVSGRIASDEEFPDENDRPLVYRRTRIEIADEKGRWRRLSEEREAVPFGLEVRSVSVGIDAAALEEGLVVIPREAKGSAADLPVEIVHGQPPSAPTRLVIEQISAVEHATVAGVPVVGSDGQPIITAGLRRPLILTTVEVDAAMRLLARGRRPLLLGAAALLVLSLAAFVLALAIGIADAIVATTLML